MQLLYDESYELRTPWYIVSASILPAYFKNPILRNPSPLQLSWRGQPPQAAKPITSHTFLSLFVLGPSHTHSVHFIVVFSTNFRHFTSTFPTNFSHLQSLKPSLSYLQAPAFFVQPSGSSNLSLFTWIPRWRDNSSLQERLKGSGAFQASRGRSGYGEFKLQYWTFTRKTP